VSQEVLVAPCPICGKAAMAGREARYVCPACGTQVEQRRWLGLQPRNQFFFRTIGAEYSNLEFDLKAHPFTREQIAELAGTCYTDDDLLALASGDLARLRPPSSTLAQIMFHQAREICYVQVNGLTRAQGPPLADDVKRTDERANRRVLQPLDEGNLFVSDQRLIFPSHTHTSIRIDRKLTGVRIFLDAIAVQRKSEDKATYFLGTEPRQASLIAAYLQGRLTHLR
jgi:endogenous inhibitor of DNA gyrase (YacG/DUF329 family)